jgi:hypothetical protein
MTRHQVSIKFWKTVAVQGADECWLWTAGKQGGGYGAFYHARTNKQELAHRVSWQLHFGKIPHGLHVLHKCDVRACCNPRHLWIGTNADNMADRDAKGRCIPPPHYKGEAHPRAKLTAVQVKKIRASSRSIRVIAATYGVGSSQIYAIRNGKNWR